MAANGDTFCTLDFAESHVRKCLVIEVDTSLTEGV